MLIEIQSGEMRRRKLKHTHTQGYIIIIYQFNVQNSNLLPLCCTKQSKSILLFPL